MFNTNTDPMIIAVSGTPEGRKNLGEIILEHFGLVAKTLEYDEASKNYFDGPHVNVIYTVYPLDYFRILREHDALLIRVVGLDPSWESLDAAIAESLDENGIRRDFPRDRQDHNAWSWIPKEWFAQTLYHRNDDDFRSGARSVVNSLVDRYHKLKSGATLSALRDETLDSILG